VGILNYGISNDKLVPGVYTEDGIAWTVRRSTAGYHAEASLNGVAVTYRERRTDALGYPVGTMFSTHQWRMKIGRVDLGWRRSDERAGEATANRLLASAHKAWGAAAMAQAEAEYEKSSTKTDKAAARQRAALERETTRIDGDKKH
jgi:hypothetical protein